jgi:hypothetical protein
MIGHNSIVYLKTNTNYYIGRGQRLWAKAFPPLNPVGEYVNLAGSILEVFDHPTVTADTMDRVPFLLQRKNGPGPLCIDDVFYLQPRGAAKGRSPMPTSTTRCSTVPLRTATEIA